MPAGLVVISIPIESPSGYNGPGYYGRYPEGNAPGAGTVLGAAATDSTAAAAALTVEDPLAGAATDTTAASAAITAKAKLAAGAADTTSAGAAFTPAGTNSIVITFPEDMPPLGVGVPVLFTMTAVGGNGDYTWGEMSNAPPGITNPPPGGNFEGTPTTAGTYDVTVPVTDSAGNYGTATLTCTVT